MNLNIVWDLVLGRDFSEGNRLKPVTLVRELFDDLFHEGEGFFEGSDGGVISPMPLSGETINFSFSSLLLHHKCKRPHNIRDIFQKQFGS